MSRPQPPDPASLPPLRPDAPAAVVVPALHAAPVVARAVASALAQPQVVEVVVAAGDAQTRTAAEAVDDPRVRVVDNPSGRTPDALNAGIRATRAEVVVRLDAHAELPPGYVPTAVDALARTGAANVGGRQVPTAERGVARAVALAMASPVGAGGAAYRTGATPGPVDTVYLGVFRRTALAAVGGFDPRFTRNQDAELNLRLARAGYLVWFEPSLAVAYRPRSTYRALASQYLQYGRWRRVTAREHRGSLRLRQVAAPALVVGLASSGVLAAALGRPWLVAAPVAGYLLAVLLAGLAAARRPRVAVLVAAALVVMHLSWGTGFLLGPPRDVVPQR
jgi:succinoglycan biosynthesis protein ExoA